MTEFITRCYGKKGFEIIIKTDNYDHYEATQDFARRLIDHAKQKTNADRIRAMSDEELVEQFYHGIDAQYCSNDPACAALLDTDEGIPEENCKRCLLAWLQQPADTHDNPDLLDEK